MNVFGPFWTLFVIYLSAVCWILQTSNNHVGDNTVGSQQGTATVRSYSRDELLNLQTSRGKLSPEAILNIKNLGIKRRMRGRRSGLHIKKKEKRVRQGVNWDNLCKLKRGDLCHHDENTDIALIIHQANVRSIKNKDHILRQSILENNIDVSFVSETWLKELDSNEEDHAWVDCCEINTNGLGFSSIPRKARRGGGIGLIYKKHYKINCIKVVSETDIEAAIWELKSDQVHFYVCGVYRSPSGCWDKFVDLFLKLVQDIVELRKVVILGDFNIHFHSDDPHATSFKDAMSAMGYDQQVNFATHNRGNILDLVFVDASGEIQAVDTKPGLLLSDHYEIITRLNTYKQHVQKKTIKTRVLENIQWEQLYKDAEIDDILGDNLDINEMIETFEHNLQREFDKHAPIKEKKVSVRKHEPWFNDEIKSAKKELQKMEKKWRSSKSDLDHRNYKQCRKEYQWKLKKMKQETISSKFNELKGDGKKLFQLLNNLTGRLQENTLPDSLSDNILANDFAESFLNKIQSIRDSLEHFDKYQVPCREINPLPSFNLITMHELRNIIKHMPTKSCEIDCIPTKFLKENLSIFEDIILKIVNVSLSSGTFPEKWKEAIIRPLHKNPKLETITKNYRPVSNLPFLSKVLEKCVLLKLQEHLDKQNLLPDYQSAYRKNYSCETAVLSVVNDILWGMEEKSVTALVAIDLTAAFDTVDHNIMSDVLQNYYGLSGSSLQWFNSYLKDRKFKVSINQAYSKTNCINYSVPQGSCAGPSLYSLYASTLQEIIPTQVQTHGYADDHCLKKQFKPQKNEAQTISLLENTLGDVNEWMHENRLKMNNKKTEFITFGSKQMLSKSTITSVNVNGEIITKSPVIRYLGVHLDEVLSMKDHINKKCRIALLNLYKIRNIRSMLTDEACKVLMCALVLSHLDYCNSVLYGLPKCSIMKLQRVQNMAAKITLRRSKYDSSKNALKDLHWLPIESRMKYKILVLVFQCLQGAAPEYLKQHIKIKSSVKQWRLRSSARYLPLEVPDSTRKTFAERSFSIAGPKLWNNLPDSIKQVENLDQFKSNLKTYFYCHSYC